MINIPKSDVSNVYAFTQEVAKYSADMRDWQAHMRRVDSDILNDVKPEARHYPYPRPVATDLIIQVVNAGGTFTIIPDPEPPLEDQKKALLQKVIEGEAAAQGAVASPAKRLMFNVQAAEASQRIQKRSLVAKISGMFVDNEDVQILKDHMERNRQTLAIHKIAAQAASDIEDLTGDTVKSWKVPEFKS